jgi:hypothetical protein
MSATIRKKSGLIIEDDDEEEIINTDDEIEELVKKLSNNFTAIINRDTLRKYPKLNWGDNGIGDRWYKKKFNYTVVTNEKVKTYSENDDEIDSEVLRVYRLENTKMKGIIGIFVHSKRLNIVKRPIKKEIDCAIKKKCCVSCGSRSEIICDHKNDIYNDVNVLNTKTQVKSDFQPLCNHCNLQKRQILKDEMKNNKLYSAKNLEKYGAFQFEFPWEKKYFDVNDVNTKMDTYWYDPVEFNKKIFQYMSYVLPVVNEIKQRNTIRKQIVTKFH